MNLLKSDDIQLLYTFPSKFTISSDYKHLANPKDCSNEMFIFCRMFV